VIDGLIFFMAIFVLPAVAENLVAAGICMGIFLVLVVISKIKEPCSRGNEKQSSKEI